MAMENIGVSTAINKLNAAKIINSGDQENPSTNMSSMADTPKTNTGTAIGAARIVPRSPPARIPAASAAVRMATNINAGNPANRTTTD